MTGCSEEVEWYGVCNYVVFTVVEVFVAWNEGPIPSLMQSSM